ncbi:MAG: sodium:solute symporter [Candidatus Aminicenantes bacterium]|nr:sodium:solute symporter [Candidatus Aminicenantes bacterium]
MSKIDWFVLITSLVSIVSYGVWKGRGSKDIEGYLLANRSMRWYVIALSVMATQASAITFLSTPGQAYSDGMRFVQFYLGLPVAMIILSITVVPIYHKLKVFTAYEYLEKRFDLKTRELAAGLFLIQRGLAAGLTIYAPSIILSTLLGWDIYLTNLMIGVLVIIYTTAGGTKAVSRTQMLQVVVIMAGMIGAFFMVLHLLPKEVTFTDALFVAGKMGKLNAIDFTFDLSNRYNFWSGVIGGLFLALSYFGTDQSQVQRYLGGKSVAHSRLGLLANGLIKVPMQFFILLIGAMVFVFYQFAAPPLFFNTVAAGQVRSGVMGKEYRLIEKNYRQALEEKKAVVTRLVKVRRSGDKSRLVREVKNLETAEQKVSSLREKGLRLIRESSGNPDANDTNYIFLNFVINFLPIGLVGLVIAAIVAASMSSTSSELNALASTTVVDVYKRLFKTGKSEGHYLRASKVTTVVWGCFAILFAQYANRLGTLVEAVNILGSLFYGTILGIFMTAFFLKKVGGTAVFYAALGAEAGVVYCFIFTDISYLWYNVVGCLLVVLLSVPINRIFKRKPRVAVSQ